MKSKARKRRQSKVNTWPRLDLWESPEDLDEKAFRLAMLAIQVSQATEGKVTSDTFAEAENVLALAKAHVLKQSYMEQSADWLTFDELLADPPKKASGLSPRLGTITTRRGLTTAIKQHFASRKEREGFRNKMEYLKKQNVDASSALYKALEEIPVEKHYSIVSDDRVAEKIIESEIFKRSELDTFQLARARSKAKAGKKTAQVKKS